MGRLVTKITRQGDISERGHVRLDEDAIEVLPGEWSEPCCGEVLVPAGQALR